MIRLVLVVLLEIFTSFLSRRGNIMTVVAPKRWHLVMLQMLLLRLHVQMHLLHVTTATSPVVWISMVHHYRRHTHCIIHYTSINFLVYRVTKISLIKLPLFVLWSVHQSCKFSCISIRDIMLCTYFMFFIFFFYL